jgi:hypothetical protein
MRTGINHIYDCAPNLSGVFGLAFIIYHYNGAMGCCVVSNVFTGNLYGVVCSLLVRVYGSTPGAFADYTLNIAG